MKKKNKLPCNISEKAIKKVLMGTEWDMVGVDQQIAETFVRLLGHSWGLNEEDKTEKQKALKQRKLKSFITKNVPIQYGSRSLSLGEGHQLIESLDDKVEANELWMEIHPHLLKQCIKKYGFSIVKNHLQDSIEKLEENTNYLKEVVESL